jgi:hypothetical protein
MIGAPEVAILPSSQAPCHTDTGPQGFVGCRDSGHLAKRTTATGSLTPEVAEMVGLGHVGGVSGHRRDPGQSHLPAI